MKLERKETLTREQVAARLSALASALAQGGHVDLDLGGLTMSLHIPDDLHSEFEVEVDGDEIEIELELKWTTGRTEHSSSGSVESPDSGD